MVVHECCTSKICSCCGALYENLKVTTKEGGTKVTHHVTRCTSAKHQENVEPCEMSTFFSSRDIPGAKALLLCTEYEAMCLFEKKMKRGKTWKDMSKAKMIKIRQDARQDGLPHYRPGRSIRREKRKARRTKV